MAHSKPSNGAAIRSENLLGTRRLGNTQCPRSARAVPAQCPRQCPPGKQSSARGSLVPVKKAEASTPFQDQKPRALLCFPGGHCRGHCAGTARALRGHCVFPRRRVTSGRQAATPLATARGHALATYPKLSGKETTVRDE